MPRERPIPFNAPMVRAVLDGSKTQTRRIVKPRYPCEIAERDDGSTWPWYPDYVTGGDGDGWVACPYGVAGDRLWVRESWRAPHALDELSPKGIADACLNAGYVAPWCPIQYEACGSRNSAMDWLEFGSTPNSAKPGRYRHARLMPRWASRITLEVTGVRVERLQAISEADAKTEGITPREVRQFWLYGADPEERAAIYRRAAVDPYRELWESINGAGSWDANPWVWMVDFKQFDTSVRRGET